MWDRPVLVPLFGTFQVHPHCVAASEPPPSVRLSDLLLAVSTTCCLFLWRYTRGLVPPLGYCRRGHDAHLWTGIRVNTCLPLRFNCLVYHLTVFHSDLVLSLSGWQSLCAAWIRTHEYSAGRVCGRVPTRFILGEQVENNSQNLQA